MSYFDKAKALAKRVPWYGWVGIGAGALLIAGKAASSQIGGAFDWAKAEAFKELLPSPASDYGDIILEVAKNTGVSPVLIYALGAQESGWGTYLVPRGPAGTGDNGHGRGLLQIDDRTWGDWLDSNDWTDPMTNVMFGIGNVFLPQRDQIAQSLGLNPNGPWPQNGWTQDDLDRAAIVAYNHGVGGLLHNVNNGLDWDVGTTGGNYSASVLSHEDSILSSLA